MSYSPFPSLRPGTDGLRFLLMRIAKEMLYMSHTTSGHGVYVLCVVINFCLSLSLPWNRGGVSSGSSRISPTLSQWENQPH